MRLHLKRLAAGAVILAILLVALWLGINNDQLINMILYVVSFCIISYLIGYFLLEIRIGRWMEKLKLMMKKYSFKAMKDQKIASNNSRRADYRKNSRSQRNRKDNINI
ncbi:hypothetical protein [Neobacillus cucumis]|uniref:hypothetical protein n=1 Tax=Neobacillus cucumis TaxID=1740721 RepID=UPI00285313C5|nr:hypothetical protein [Neobacillus cucumis]MDR4947146.1 hypothetical protein [Neobacillus cucumis]